MSTSGTATHRRVERNLPAKSASSGLPALVPEVAAKSRRELSRQ